MNFFVSCLFFDDDSVARKFRFRDSDEMNRDIIEGWNRVVTNTDNVYILGGVGEFEYLKSLNGKKILLFSEHEKSFFNTYVSGVTNIRNSSIDKEMFELYVSENYGISRVIFNNKIVIKLYSGREISMTTHLDGLDSDRFNLVGCLDNIPEYFKFYLTDSVKCLNTDIRNNLLHPFSEHYVESFCKVRVG